MLNSSKESNKERNMNLVSKRQLISTLAATLCWSTFANECGQIELIQQQSEELIKTVSHIVDIDDRNSAIQLKYEQLDDDTIVYLMRPGYHRMKIANTPFRLIQKWPKMFTQSNYSQTGTGGKKVRNLAQKIQMHEFLIHIKADTQYKVALAEKNGRMVYEIVEKKAMVCKQSDTKNLLGSLDERRSVVLPTMLERRLEKMMTMLATSNDEVSQENFWPLSLSTSFGALIAENYTSDGFIRVLTVLPGSIAFDMGIRSGDEISKLNYRLVEKTELSPQKIFSNYLFSVPYFSKFRITIRRNDEDKNLFKKNNPEIIPASRYTIGAQIKENINYPATLSQQNYFDYLQLIVDIENYLNAESNIDNRILIRQPRKRKLRLGIDGITIENQGLQITGLNEHSFLKNDGLRVGDVIKTVGKNNLSVVKTNLLTDYFVGILDGQQYVLSVLRDKQVVEISGNYQIQYTPAFEFEIDLLSKSLFKKGISKMSRRMKGSNKQWQFSSFSRNYGDYRQVFRGFHLDRFEVGK